MASTRSTIWFWSDWAGDQEVRRLTPEERGVWIDLLALAAVGKPFGYVCDAKGRPVELEEIGRFVNCRDLGLLAKLIAAIVDKGAASRDRAGRLFNRRMVRDAHLSEKRSKAGRAGAAKSLENKKMPVLPGQNTGQKQEWSGSLDPPDVHTGVEVERVRARAGSITPEAFTLADRVGDALGWDRDDHRRVGVPYEAQRWLTNDWLADLCVDTIRRVSATKPGKPLAYFVPAIAQAHADLSKPLPVVAIDQPPEVIHAQASPRHPGGAYGASKDRFREAHAALKASIAADEDGEEGGGSVVEFLPASRRQ